MPSKPNNSQEVYEEMLKYCKSKNFNFTDKELEYMAEDCFLVFESRNWKGISYWPAVAKRWVLNKVSKSSPYTKGKEIKPKPKGKTIRDRILEQQENKDEVL